MLKEVGRHVKNVGSDEHRTHCYFWVANYKKLYLVGLLCIRRCIWVLGIPVRSFYNSGSVFAEWQKGASVGRLPRVGCWSDSRRSCVSSGQNPEWCCWRIPMWLRHRFGVDERVSDLAGYRTSIVLTLLKLSSGRPTAALPLLNGLGSLFPFREWNPIVGILVVNAPSHFGPPRTVFLQTKMQKKGRQFVLAFRGPIGHFPHYLSHAHCKTMPDLACWRNADCWRTN
jgi:hypothetical protein